MGSDPGQLSVPWAQRQQILDIESWIGKPAPGSLPSIGIRKGSAKPVWCFQASNTSKLCNLDPADVLLLTLHCVEVISADPALRRDDVC